MVVCALALPSYAKKDERDRKRRKSLSEWSKKTYGDGENPCRTIMDACRRAGHTDIERYGENKQKQCIDDVLHGRTVDRVDVSAASIDRCRKHKDRKK